MSPTHEFLPVARPLLGPEEEEAVVRVLRSGWLTQGPEVRAFEEEFAAWVGAPQAVAVSSGTTALHLILAALGVGPGDEVICPSFSFIATANAIRHTGATPVFADIDPDTFNIAPDQLPLLLSPRTRAIVPVHQAGLPADLDPILRIAASRGVPVVEDAACAAGARYKGVAIGRPHGAAACFSFHPRKLLTTAEGGMITTRDPELASRLRRLRHHGMSIPDTERHESRRVLVETYDEIGYNYRLSDVHAAIGRVQLQRLPAAIERRRQLAARYSQSLSPMGRIRPPVEPPGFHHTYQSYVVRLEGGDRTALMQGLLDHGIATRRIQCIHREPPYRPARSDALVATEALAETHIVLPLFAQMSEADVDRVVVTIERLHG